MRWNSRHRSLCLEWWCWWVNNRFLILNLLPMKYKTMKSLRHEFEEKASYVVVHLLLRHKYLNDVFSENSFLCINHIHHKENNVKVLHRYTSVLNYYKLYILGWGNNRWLSTRTRDGSRGTSLALESTSPLISLMRRKYNCIDVFNEAYTGSCIDIFNKAYSKDTTWYSRTLSNE